MYLITGGAGFIGSNLIAEMEKRGLGPIIVVDRLRDGSKWLNVAKRNLYDIVNPENLIAFLHQQSTSIHSIIHLGAISSTTERDVDLLFDVNFRLSVNLWNWCTDNGVPFIYASSAATYGDGSKGFDDDSRPEFLDELKPLNAYGWSKNLFDRRISHLVSEGGLTPPQWAGLKFFNVYGPNEYHKGKMASVISKAYHEAINGRSFELFKSHNPKYKDGRQLRDFIWVGDCIEIILWLLENRTICGLFNCGSGKARSFFDVVGLVYKALEDKAQIKFVDTPTSIRENYQYFTEANMLRLREKGYKKPMVSLEEGIVEYVTKYLNTSDQYR